LPGTGALGRLPGRQQDPAGPSPVTLPGCDFSTRNWHWLARLPGPQWPSAAGHQIPGLAEPERPHGW
jgi:hypothetical protein